MEKIPTSSPAPQGHIMNDIIMLEQSGKKRIMNSITNNARTLMIIFILFVVVVVMTTDIRFVTVSDLKNLGLEFFLLLFCSYAMYVYCADGGSNAGFATESYQNAVQRFTDLKQKIINEMLYPRLNEFCAYYAAEELKKTRMQYLLVASITYEEYLEKYSKLTRAEINALDGITKIQKKAIIHANRVRQIRFTPDMMTTMQGKSFFARFSLYATPKARRYFSFSAKLVKMTFLSVGMSLIALEVILEPSWIVFAEVCMKLATVVLHGFDGHKMGFINIAVDTVNYTEQQSDFMQQAIQYIEAHPAGKTTA